MKRKLAYTGVAILITLVAGLAVGTGAIGPFLFLWLLFSFGVGVAFVAIGIWLAGDGGVPLIGDALAVILHIVASIGRGRTVVVQQGNQYRVVAADPVRDDTGTITAWRYTVDGKQYQKESVEHVIRLWKRPWAFVPAVDEQWWREFTNGDGVQADGGGLVVRGKQVMRRIGRGGSPDISRTAEEKALAKYGGSDRVETKAMVVGIVVLTVFGFFSAWVVFG